MLTNQEVEQRLKTLQRLSRRIAADNEAIIGIVEELRATDRHGQYECSWAVIGIRLGITRQAAHERFASELDRRSTRKGQR